jgi:hypothetical protein
LQQHQNQKCFSNIWQAHCALPPVPFQLGAAVHYQIDGPLITLSEPFANSAWAWIAAAITIVVITAAFAIFVEWLKQSDDEGLPKLVRYRNQFALAATAAVIGIFLVGIDPHRRTSVINIEQQTVHVRSTILSATLQYIFLNRLNNTYEADEIAKFGMTTVIVRASSKHGGRERYRYDVPAVFLRNGQEIRLTNREYSSKILPGSDAEAFEVIRNAWKFGPRKVAAGGVPPGLVMPSSRPAK